MNNQETPIQFTGTGREYFGIWIVNLLLSIITLGIYSAWAKVRRKKYFYNNTLIDNVGFDYHADPKAILKGRIIAFVIFMAYQFLAGFSPVIAGGLFILFLIAVPWIITRGMIFNARNSSHRGLRFDFDGRVGEAAKVFIVFPMLAYITLGLAFPWVMQRVQKFIYSNHKFGTSHFEMDAKVKDFYMVYLKLFGAVLLLGGLLVFVGKQYLGDFIPKTAQAPIVENQAVSHQPQHEVNGFIKVRAPQAEGELSVEDYLKDLTPEERATFEAEVRKLNESDDFPEKAPTTEKQDPVKEMLDKFGSFGALGIIGMLLGIVLYSIIIFSFVAYTQSRISNLVWNNTTVDHLSFKSTQRMRDLLWIYVTNILALVLTLGLATPWAQVRLAKYRMEHLSVLGETDWDKFIGEKKEHAQSVGEEIAEIFDVDLAF